MALKLAAEVVTLKTKHPFVIARGGGDDANRVVWVRLTDTDGVEGWGEADPSRYYGETADTVLAVLERLAPHLPRDPFDLEAAEARFAEVVPKNAAARAATLGAAARPRGQTAQPDGLDAVGARSRPCAPLLVHDRSRPPGEDAPEG